MKTVLRAKNMTKIYGLGSKQPFTALENIDLEIKTGEFIVVMGPSGSGKSTLVNNVSKPINEAVDLIINPTCDKQIYICSPFKFFLFFKKICGNKYLYNPYIPTTPKAVGGI